MIKGILKPSSSFQISIINSSDLLFDRSADKQQAQSEHNTDL